MHPLLEDRLKSLNTEERFCLRRLEGRLSIEPEPFISAHACECREVRLLRWLNTELYNVDSTFRKLHEHVTWWLDYGMDDFREEDELDENGVMYVCGEDERGAPTIVARPCMHNVKTKQESILSARRCVYTVQRCIERMPPGHERITIVYDAKDVGIRQLDLVFCKELIPVLTNQFPGRLARVLVINTHWSVRNCWSIVSPLLHPDTRERVVFCQRGTSEALSILTGHPYLLHALQVQQALRQKGAAAAARLPLPPRSPYVPRWREAMNVGEITPSLRCPTPHNCLQEERLATTIDTCSSIPAIVSV